MSSKLFRAIPGRQIGCSVRTVSHAEGIEVHSFDNVTDVSVDARGELAVSSDNQRGFPPSITVFASGAWQLFRVDFVDLSKFHPIDTV